MSTFIKSSVCMSVVAVVMLSSINVMAQSDVSFAPPIVDLGVNDTQENENLLPIVEKKMAELEAKIEESLLESASVNTAEDNIRDEHNQYENSWALN